MLKTDPRKACTQTFCSSVRGTALLSVTMAVGPFVAGVPMAVAPVVDGWVTEFPDGTVFVDVFDDAFAAATPMP